MVQREIWPNLRANFISQTGDVTPQEFGKHAFDINLYLHEYFELISIN